MKVILSDFVPKLGAPGEIVVVAPGYARNYLIPQKLALEASRANITTFNNNRRQRSRKLAQVVSEAQEARQALEAIESIVFERRAGESGKLFGSVTSADIADALGAKGFNIDKKQINLGRAVKSLGDNVVSISLHHDILAELKFSVQRERDADGAESPEKEPPDENPTDSSPDGSTTEGADEEPTE